MIDQSPQLLKTRGKVGAAIGITALLLALGIFGARPTGWLLPLEFIIHGSALLAVNVIFYCYLWWGGLCFVRGTHGRERIFILGWITAILLWPLESLRPQWTGMVGYIGDFGLVVALITLVGVLLRPNQFIGSSTKA